MRSKRLRGDGARHVLVFDKGHEVIGRLLGFATHEAVTAASFTGIGAFRDVCLGYFDWERRDYLEIPLDEQVEVLSLVGSIASKDDGAAQVHAHVVLGRSDGTTRGGHLLEAHVRPTLEVILTESPEHLQRRFDEEVGLALIEIGD